MAKKHSSKTATQEALQAANPRLQVFNKWAGVNFKDAPLGWEPGETKFYAHHQTDLPLNNWLIQNNMVVDMSDSVSTRDDAEILVEPPDGYEFTGVACIWRHYLLLAATPTLVPAFQIIYWYDISPNASREPHPINMYRKQLSGAEPLGLLANEVFEIGYYENTFIALVSNWDISESTIAVTMPTPDNDTFNPLESYAFYAEAALGEPYYRFDVRSYGMDSILGEDYDSATEEEKAKCKVRFTFVYTLENKWGSTIKSPPVTIWVEEDPYGFSSQKYIKLINQASNHPGIVYQGHGFWIKDENGNPKRLSSNDFTGIDIWVNQDENQNYVLIDHIEMSENFYINESSQLFHYNWFGTLTNTDAYSNAPLWMPQEDTTFGPIARHFTTIDSRFYWWGDPDKPWRVLIGGNVGNELSTSRSVGGGWVDIEPGSGYYVTNCLKWKTASGANIVTVLTGSENSTRESRFNLVEMTSTFTNEISVKGWQYEEVSNVVGCSSRWGSAVFGDGLYCLSRYGLMLTTMTSEYNNQMKNQKVSEVIDPIFTERIGKRLDDARLVHIDGIVYIILSESSSEAEPTNLDKVILCYDLDKKAWYTFTPGAYDYQHEEEESGDGDDSSVFLHAMAIDSKDNTEGLGIITKKAVTLYPTTGIQRVAVPDFDILLESGELCSRVPMQSPYYVEQLEFRFDYFIGYCELIIEGVDYYGRKFEISKYLGTETGHSPDPDLEKRDYVEWVRVQKLVEFFRIRIKGPCRCRLTHIINKAYLYNNLIGMPYGFDAQDTFINRHGKEESIHHYIDDYNNLRRAIVT